MEWFISIFIPILCAIIGGLITLIGVRWTIKYEKEQDLERRKVELKPIFYRIDPFQKYDSESVMEYFLRFKSKGLMDKEVGGLFKNTDQAIIKLDYIVMGDLHYYPQNGNVIDKNTFFELRILTNKIPKEHTIMMRIQDVLGNKYWYKMHFSRKYGIYNISDLKECQMVGKKET